MCFENLHGVLGSLRLAVGVRDTDVDDAIRSAGPEAANQKVSTIFALALVQVSTDCRLGFCCLHFLFGATEMDFWFVANRRGGEGSGGKVAEFVSDLGIA